VEVAVTGYPAPDLGGGSDVACVWAFISLGGEAKLHGQGKGSQQGGKEDEVRS
jgi:hypothetical protein